MDLTRSPSRQLWCCPCYRADRPFWSGPTLSFSAHSLHSRFRKHWRNSPFGGFSSSSHRRCLLRSTSWTVCPSLKRVLSGPGWFSPSSRFLLASTPRTVRRRLPDSMSFRQYWIYSSLALRWWMLSPCSLLWRVKRSVLCWSATSRLFALLGSRTSLVSRAPSQVCVLWLRETCCCRIRSWSANRPRSPRGSASPTRRTPSAPKSTRIPSTFKLPQCPVFEPGSRTSPATGCQSRTFPQSGAAGSSLDTEKQCFRRDHRTLPPRWSCWSWTTDGCLRSHLGGPESSWISSLVQDCYSTLIPASVSGTKTCSTLFCSARMSRTPGIWSCPTEVW